MTAKWNGSAWTIAPLPTIPMVGAGTEEAEEAEEPIETQEKDNSLDAMMDRVATQPDYVRGEIFRDLKEFRRRKKPNPYVGRQEQARVEMRAEMYSVLREDAERSQREIPNGGAMPKNASVGILYENENGKQSYIPPRQFSEEDRERANQNRNRFTRSQWCRTLLDLAQGRITMTKEQFHAHIIYGRSKGWHLPPPSKR